MNKKFICFLLLIIIIFSSILIYKIEQIPNYNIETYAKVYDEYNQIINASINSSKTNEQNLSNSTLKPDATIIYKNSTGTNYKTIGVLNIPKINISYPIINECTDSNLNIAPAKLIGPSANTIGNLVIVGHNNWNKDFFSNLHKLEKNDTIELIDIYGKKLCYRIYDKYEVNQKDLSCLEQNTNGKTELTLITCIKYQKNKRLVVKCVAE